MGWFRDELDSRGPPLIPADPMQANDQLRILADRVGVVAASRQNAFPIEHPEGPRDDHQRAQPAPRVAGDQERAEILHRLDQREQAVRQGCAHDMAVPHRAAVTHPHRAGNRDGSRIVHKWLPGPQQGVWLEDGVDINRAKQPAARNGDARVQRVALSAIRLIHDDQVAGVRCVDRTDRCVGGRGVRANLELERMDKRRQSAVVRAVVDHDNLMVGIVLAQQPRVRAKR